MTQLPETVMPRLEVRYSVLYLTARMMGCVGGALWLSSLLRGT